MAKIIGAITTSHVPAIGGAIAKRLHGREMDLSADDGAGCEPGLAG